MFTRTTVLVLALGALTAIPALAGPPLICHAEPIGSAPSLPWQNSGGWNGMLPSYNVAHLVSDTLTLLHPGVTVPQRMETMRRAAIYSSRDPGLAMQIATRLLARADDPATPDTSRAVAYFDAGFFAEAVREAVEAYPMLHDPAQSSAWHLRSNPLRIDPAPLLARAEQYGNGEVRRAAFTTLGAVRR